MRITTTSVLIEKLGIHLLYLFAFLLFLKLLHKSFYLNGLQKVPFIGVKDPLRRQKQDYPASIDL